MRDLNREAWFLYQVTSIEHFERCAQACQEFAEEWAQEYYDYAKDIRRYVELVKLGDYMPMSSELGSVRPSWRGIEDRIDSRMSAETEKALDAAFDRMSVPCSTANLAMRNNQWAGLYWVNREEHKHEQELVDRDDGIVGEAYEWYVSYLQEMGFLPKPEHYPQYRIDKTRSCRAGETCPWTGVWVPEPALTEGLEKFSLAFAMGGRPMQPAYRIVADYHETLDDDPEYPTVNHIIKTKAEDALWYPVLQVASDTTVEARPDHGRLRALPNELVPQTGWWWSPAFTGADALRHFNQGEHFPSTETTNYGGVFWYYDADRQPKE